MPTIKDELERLKYSSPKEHVCMIVWSIDDVLQKARELKVKISHKEAEEILDKMENDHDACIGISWDTISIYIFDLNALRQHLKVKENKKEKVGFT